MSQVLIQQNLGDAQGYQNILPTNITSEVANMFVNSGGAQYTNDVLKYIGKYCMYWWQRRKKTIATNITEQNLSDSSAIGRSGGNTIAYSKTPMTEQDLFANGTVVTLTSSSSSNAQIAQTLVNQAPCYVGTGYGQVYKIPSGATFSSNYSSTLTLYMERADIIANKTGSPVATLVTSITTSETYTDWEYLQSTNRNTYPDFGTSGEYEYQFLNIPFENSLSGCKIQTGSYVGTRTYGKDNPCSLTFDFITKAIFIMEIGNRQDNTWNITVLTDQEDTSHFIGGRKTTSSVNNSSITIISMGKNVKWYSERDANAQFNLEQTSYVYIVV